MTVLLLEHLPGCSPLYPCASCNLTAALRKKLSPHEFKKLERYLSTQAGQAPSKPARFDPSISTMDLKTGLKNLGYVLDSTSSSVRRANKKPPR